MSDSEQAVSFVREAEGRVRAMMERALSEQRYRDLSAVAPIAEALAAICREGGAEEQEHGVITISETSEKGGNAFRADAGGAGMAAKQKLRTDEYPRFERDGSKLVKVGWSKKDRREYEHRVPREAVSVVARSLCSSVKPGAVFSMEQMLPFKSGDAGDIPSYQAYLALAWFRHIDAVVQQGKAGYTMVPQHLQQNAIEIAWDKLPSHREEK